eukprot:TCALIF_14026-PA protein Name:"Protein of unknown function" AED:0.00 eAED:0.00 QI:23/1/0.5/1/0/0/2/0/102
MEVPGKRSFMMSLEYSPPNRQHQGALSILVKSCVTSASFKSSLQASYPNIWRHLPPLRDMDTTAHKSLIMRSRVYILSLALLGANCILADCSDIPTQRTGKA